MDKETDIPGCGALSGIRVLDLGRMVAGPYCAMMLAGMGAEVIKIEDPKGGDMSRENLPKKDGESTYFVAYNCSKSGMTLNLKSGKGKEILAALIQKSDVLIENFRPGVMERLGFGYKKAAELNPRLIYASISGYGQSGELAERAAFDPIAQAMSGMISVTGALDGNMVRCGASIADVLAAQNAASAILAAIIYREKSGRGQYIDVALTDSCISAMSSVNQIYLTTGKVPKPLGNSFEASAPGGCYQTSDGNIMLLAGRNCEFEKLAIVLGHPEWLKNGEFKEVKDRVKNRGRLDDIINEQTKKYRTKELLDKLLAARLPVGEIYNVAQVVNEPHFREQRQMFVDVDHPRIGKVKVTNLPVKMSETPVHIGKCAPMLGQDNHKVLSDLGFSQEDIKELSIEKVI